MKTNWKMNRLIRLIGTAVLTLGVALPFGAAQAAFGCYKPMNMEAWMYGLADLETNIWNLYEKEVSFDGANAVVTNTNGVPTRLVYHAQGKGDLTTLQSRNKYGHGIQHVYDANGKVTNLVDHYTMQNFTGSVIRVRKAVSGLPPGQLGGPNGARLAGEISPLNFGPDSFEGDHIISIPMEIDCSTEQTKIYPDVWNCTFTAAIIGFPVDLVKVNPNNDPYCSTFQNNGDRRWIK